MDSFVLISNNQTQFLVYSSAAWYPSFEAPQFRFLLQLGRSALVDTNTISLMLFSTEVFGDSHGSSQIRL